MTRIAFIGCGAANVACSRLIFAWGVKPSNCIMVDSKGILGKHRKDLEQRRAEYVDKWRLCNSTNAEGRVGGIPDAMKGMDVVIALSTPGPGVILPEWISSMNRDAIVFACANPVPEIWPWEAKEAGATIVATGRSDVPNQVNNSLGFPGIFRGTLDVRASTITDEMCFAAAQALADQIVDRLDEDHILGEVLLGVDLSFLATFLLIETKLGDDRAIFLIQLFPDLSTARLFGSGIFIARRIGSPRS